ncbi:MAG TPA: anti-sigma regulatory factor [Ideonella sp.]|uniref:anti-sigma regulatory factor n=1 Tax=Ideonella sp. TaxID=1929293 RepID=UPI002BCB4517|nr:anti-sigma regulatory factor [Ideonella sp.]HSI51736.1 anti-sigma regulatory factor [Ideonella sp.]
MTVDVTVSIECEADIVSARQKGRELAAATGFSSTDQTMIALAISEIARNIVTYARQGKVSIGLLDEGGHRGVLIIAWDEGPGIPDIELAMRDGYSTGRSLGVGLPGSKRVMDDFELVSAPGRGTTVTMRKWLR